MASKEKIEAFEYDNGVWGICTNLYPDPNDFPSELGISEIADYLPRGLPSNTPRPTGEENRYFIRLVTVENTEKPGDYLGKLEVNNVWGKRSENGNEKDPTVRDRLESIRFDYHEDFDILTAMRPLSSTGLIEVGLSWKIRHYQIIKTPNKTTTSRSLIVWEKASTGTFPHQYMTAYPWCTYRGKAGVTAGDVYDEAELPEDIFT